MVELNTICNEDNIETIKKLENESIDLCFTSPPYYNARDYSTYTNVEEYLNTIMQTFKGIHRVLKESRMCIINVSPVLVPRESRSKQSYRIPIPFYLVPRMEEIGFEFLEDIIWKKPDGAAPNRNGGFYRHRKPVAYKPNIVTEYILVFKKKCDFLIDKVIKNDSLILGDYERTNVWEINPETKSKHPAPFPEELARKIVKYYSYEKEVVYDPYMGSGTTAKVCEELNRKWIGSDYTKEYCDMTKKRINNLHKI